MNMNIDHLQLFVRLASTQNISQAGSELGISSAVASTYIRKLEETLGVRLAHRTTRKVALTAEGQTFLPHAQEVLASVEAACASVGSGSTSPTGTLRITAPASFGRMHMIHALKGFYAAYPNLKVDLYLTDTMVDLVKGGYDLAIRNAPLKDSSLIARKLATDKRILCASPEYLAQHGEPHTPDELHQHDCVQLIGLETWQFQTPSGQQSIKVNSNLRIDNGEAVRDACVNGLGIGMGASWSVYQYLQRGELVQVLKNYPLLSDSAIWAVYPSSRLLAPRVKAFIDYFAAFYGSPPYWALD